MGPAAVCDACGQTLCSLHQVGAACPRCSVGVMQHRSLWQFTRWPDGTLTATPRDDLTDQDVEAINAEHAAYRQRTGARR